MHCKSLWIKASAKCRNVNVMSEISIWPFAKHDLVLGGKSLVGNHRGQMFLVVGHQVCTHLRRDFVPILFADPLRVIKVLRLTFVNSNLQLPPQIFNGIKVWRLARPLQDLNVLLLEPLLCCLGRAWVLGLCHAAIPIHDTFSMPCLASMPWPWRCMAPSIVLWCGAVALSP